MIDLKYIDRGVRKLVALLNAQGFTTTDSGDGVSKPAVGRVFDVPHVFMIIKPQRMVGEAKRLRRVLERHGVRVEPGTIQASYDPVDGVGVLAVFCVSDAMLTAKGPA